MKKSFACLLSTLPLLALAHSGHDALSHGAFAAGFLHSFSGADHLVLALGFGFLACKAQRFGGVKGSITLLTMLLAGFALTTALALPTSIVEGGIVVSVIAIAVALFCGHERLLLPLIALTGIFHGLAHGLELPAGFAPLPFAFGMSFAMLLVFTAGALIQGGLRTFRPMVGERTGKLLGLTSLLALA